jgi:hypothetical protein
MKPKKFEYDVKDRKSINAKLNDFCYLNKPDSFIEITEWANGDGFDITINDKITSFTCGELDAIKALVKKLNKL